MSATTLNLWPLLTGGRCSEIVLCYKKLKLELQNGGRCRQVVAIRRWSNPGLTVPLKYKKQLVLIISGLSYFDEELLIFNKFTSILVCN
jgi:hypothetical protein